MGDIGPVREQYEVLPVREPAPKPVVREPGPRVPAERRENWLTRTARALR